MQIRSVSGLSAILRLCASPSDVLDFALLCYDAKHRQWRVELLELPVTFSMGHGPEVCGLGVADSYMRWPALYG